MFSSNQILDITGELSLKQLRRALKFALKFSGDYNCFIREEKPAKCVYQIAEDGTYCIGWNPSNETEDGWNEFPFDFDIKIISNIILRHLAEQKIEEDIGDGGYHKGFRMQVIEEWLSDDLNGIKKPFYGIVSFSPYTVFYSK